MQKKIIIINVRSTRASGLIASGSKIKMHLMIPLFRIEVKDLSISGQILLTLGGGEIINIHSTQRYVLTATIIFYILPAFSLLVAPS